MASATVHESEGQIRDQLLDRRQRLQTVIADAPDALPLSQLLEEVDATLARIELGTFGLCDVCHDPIETGRIHADPLARACLGCLTATEQRALERDLDLAGHVQRSLLPPAALRVDGWEAGYHYQPAGSASGDFVDLIPLDSGELVFLIGDVSGKGLAASLLMTHLHAIVRSLIAVRLPFSELVERANRIFYESVGGQGYATLVCGKANRAGEIELSNAGHCPPLWLRDGAAITLPPTSVPVGLFASAPFPTMRATLGVGETLLVYTDGVTETLDAAGREYGQERLVRAIRGRHTVPIPDLMSGCLTDLARFRGDGPRRDDLTLFALRRWL